MQIRLISLHNNENQWTNYAFLSKLMKTYENPMFWYENQWDFYQHWKWLKIREFLSKRIKILINSMNFYKISWKPMQFQSISLHNNENQWTIYAFLSKIMKTHLKFKCLDTETNDISIKTIEHSNKTNEFLQTQMEINTNSIIFVT